MERTSVRDSKLCNCLNDYFYACGVLGIHKRLHCEPLRSRLYSNTRYLLGDEQRGIVQGHFHRGALLLEQRIYSSIMLGSCLR